MIDDYVDEFRRWTIGSRGRREALVRELRAHLLEAEEAGQLAKTLERLGSPREAARAFSEGHVQVPARLSRRLAAAIADLLPFGALLMAAYWLPDWPGPDLHRETRWTLIGLAVLWWNIGLPLAEWRAGRTPGKWMLGLQVAAEDGTRISAGQAFLRRVPTFIGFPLLVLDLPMALQDPRRRRAFDRMAGTMVIEGNETERPSRWERSRALATQIVLFVSISLVLIELWAIASEVLPGTHPFWPAVPILAVGLVVAVRAWRIFVKGPASP